MSKKLLENHLKELQKAHANLSELAPQDLVEQDETPETKRETLDPETLDKEKRKCDFLKNQERVAQLADEYGFDGRIFRELPQRHLEASVLYDSSIKQLRKQIEIIPKIVAAIKKPVDKSVLDDSPYFNVHQLAKYLGMGLGTVREQHVKGKLPEPLSPPKLSDGKKHSTAKLKWYKKDIEFWLKVGKPERQQFNTIKEAKNQESIED